MSPRRSSHLLLMIVVVVSTLFLINCTGTDASPIKIAKTRIKIVNDAMEPALKKDGVYGVMDVTLKDLKRGDIVAFKLDDAAGVRRLVGLPGEKVDIREGKIYINDQPLVENYLPNSPEISTDPASFQLPVVLKENQYFVIADNRKAGGDSRFFGPIDGDQITGQVILSK